MDKETRAFLFQGDSMFAVTHHYAKVVSRVTLEGVTYITSADLNVYVSYPLFNCHTGDVEELWLTAAQKQHFREAREFTPPPPRMFDLPKIGLPQNSRRTKDSVDGHLSPGSLTSVRQDNGGHWWCGDSDSCSVRPYMTEPVKLEGVFKPPELRFLFPNLSYLGPDTEVWYNEWRSEGQKTRLTLCSSDVAKIISSHGVWGHYFPKGKARIDVKLAGKQANKHRAGMVDYDSMKLEVKAANKATEAAEQRWHEAMDRQNAADTDMRQTKGALERQIENQAAEIKQLTERLRDAEERVLDLLPAAGGSVLDRV